MLPNENRQLSGVVAHVCHPSTPETRAEKSAQVQGQLGLRSEYQASHDTTTTLSKCNRQTKIKNKKVTYRGKRSDWHLLCLLKTQKRTHTWTSVPWACIPTSVQGVTWLAEQEKMLRGAGYNNSTGVAELIAAISCQTLVYACHLVWQFISRGGYHSGFPSSSRMPATLPNQRIEGERKKSSKNCYCKPSIKLTGYGTMTKDMSVKS